MCKVKKTRIPFKARQAKNAAWKRGSRNGWVWLWEKLSNWPTDARTQGCTHGRPTDWLTFSVSVNPTNFRQTRWSTWNKKWCVLNAWLTLIFMSLKPPLQYSFVKNVSMRNPERTSHSAISPARIADATIFLPAHGTGHIIKRVTWKRH